MDFGQFFRERLKKVSTAAIDALLNSIVSNQDLHLSNLQDMQKWSIVKLLQKSTTNKYLNQQPCVVPVNEVRFLSDLLSNWEETPVGKSAQDSLEWRDNPNKSKRPFRGSVGSLVINLKSATMILAENPHDINKKVTRAYEWKVTVHCNGAQMETPSSFLTHVNSLEREADAPYEILWDCTLVLDGIQDLWSDVCITLCWRKSPCLLSDKNDKRGGNDFFSFNRIPMVAACATEKVKKSHCDERPLLADTTCHAELKETILKFPLFSKLKEAPPRSIMRQSNSDKSCHQNDNDTQWNDYARAIIPLSTLLSSYGDKNRWCKMLYGFPEQYQGPFEFSLHLFPPDDIAGNKYLRPIPGFLGFGMSSPKVTLGFINIKVKFNFSVNPCIAPLYSNMSPPASRWIVSSSFEPQYLLTYGMRTLNLLTDLPEWIPKFLHIFTYNDMQNRNGADILCIGVFWVFFLAAILLVNVDTVPICLTGCLISVSLSYRFGYRKVKPCRKSFLYRRRVSLDNHVSHQARTPLLGKSVFQGEPNNLRRKEEHCFCEFRGTPLSPRSLSDSRRDQNERNHLRKDSFPRKLDKEFFTIKRDLPLWQDTTKEAFRNTAPANTFAPNHLVLGKSPVSCNLRTQLEPKLKCQKNKKREFFVGEAGTRRLEDYFNENELPLSVIFESINAGNLSFKNMHEKERGSLTGEAGEQKHAIPTPVKPEKPITSKSSKSVGCQKQFSPVCYRLAMLLKRISVLDSPLGALALKIKDPKYNTLDFPVFAEDAGEPDLQEILGHILVLLDNVQTFLGVFSSIWEKIQYAFNWDDPMLTVTSYFVIIYACINTHAFLRLFSRAPRWLKGFPILMIFLGFIMITDPVAQLSFWKKKLNIDIPYRYHVFLTHRMQQASDSSNDLFPLRENQSLIQKKDETKAHVEAAGAIHTQTGISAFDDQAIDTELASKMKERKRVTDLSTHSRDPSPSCPLIKFNTQKTHLDKVAEDLLFKRASHEEKNSPDIIEGCKSSTSHGMASPNNLMKTQDLNLSDIPIPGHHFSIMDSELQRNYNFDNISTNIYGTNATKGELSEPLKQESSGYISENKKSDTSISFLRAAMNFLAILASRLSRLLFTEPQGIGAICRCLLIPIKLILLICVRLTLGYLEFSFRLFWYWFARLPDQREIEHRQIAGSQYVGKLEELHPSYESQCEGIDLENINEKVVTTYLSKCFRALNESMDPTAVLNLFRQKLRKSRSWGVPKRKSETDLSDTENSLKNQGVKPDSSPKLCDTCESDLACDKPSISNSPSSDAIQRMLSLTIFPICGSQPSFDSQNEILAPFSSSEKDPNTHERSYLLNSQESSSQLTNIEVNEKVSIPDRFPSKKCISSQMSSADEKFGNNSETSLHDPKCNPAVPWLEKVYENIDERTDVQKRNKFANFFDLLLKKTVTRKR